MKYFVSYTTNRLELPTAGWNVWEVKENKKPPGNARSFKIINVLIGGKRDPYAKSVVATSAHVVETRQEVFKKIFEIAEAIV